MLRLVNDTRNDDDDNADDDGNSANDMCLTIYFVVIKCVACVYVLNTRMMNRMLRRMQANERCHTPHSCHFVYSFGYIISVYVRLCIFVCYLF